LSQGPAVDTQNISDTIGVFHGLNFAAPNGVAVGWTVNGPGVNNVSIFGLDVVNGFVQIDSGVFQVGESYTFTGPSAGTAGVGITVNNKDWTFGTDGSLAFPNGLNDAHSQIYTTNGGYQTIFEAFNTGTGRGSGQKLTLDYDDAAVKIQSWPGSEWKFGQDGNLKVPGNIVFNSDSQGLGNSIDLSRDITISSGKNIIIKPGSSGVVGTTSWSFGENSLTFPDSTQQTTAYQLVTVPVTSKGVNGDAVGRIAFDSNYIYYCTASYDGDNNIWKRVALSTDTWDNTPPPPVTYSLTVITAGDGDGTVTSSPAGISSPTLTAAFAENTSVTLSANAQIGSTFAGWSGAAYGTAPAQITMDGDKTVTATFDLNSPPPPLPPTPSYNYSVDNVTPSLGTPVTITITTTDVEDGTTLYWQLTNTQTPSGFDTDTSGYITISGNTAAVTITMTDDGGLGDHTVQTIQWTFNLYSDSGYLDQLVQFTASGADQYI
jgi:hypothetical protein